MAELVVAPALKPTEDGVEALLGVLFKLAINGDVTRIANLFRQVRCVVNVFGFEVGVFLGALQVAQVNAQVKITQRQVDETGVPRFVACQVSHQLFDIGIGHIFANLVVQNTT